MMVAMDGSPVSRLGLAGNPKSDPRCVRQAFDAGVNFFFFYNFSFAGLVDGLQALLGGPREGALVATGTETRDGAEMIAYLDQVCRRLSVDVVDVFFAEYVSPADDVEQLLSAGGALGILHEWKREGRIRYVGATVHSRPLALKLMASGKVDVLMHRYNIAHRGSEEEVLPAALAAGIPVVAFTCTRWGTLLRGHRDWKRAVPSAADCYRFALGHPAVQVALTAPESPEHLRDNLRALGVGGAEAMGEAELESQREYGDLVYGQGKDAFETEWP